MNNHLFSSAPLRWVDIYLALGRLENLSCKSEHIEFYKLILMDGFTLKVWADSQLLPHILIQLNSFYL